MRTGINFYTLRHLEESTPELIRRAASTDLDGVEFGTGNDRDAIADALEETGLSLASVMVGDDTLADGIEDVAEAAHRFDTESVVLGWLPPERFESVDAIEETAAMLGDYVDEFADHDLRFCYHNHDQECRIVDGRPAIDRLAEAAPNLRFELDVGWVGTGGLDPVETLDRYGDRIPIVHAKDMHFEPGEFAELGDGDLDLDGVVEVAREHDVEWIVYEHDQPDDPEESLETGSRRLVEAVHR